MGTCAGWFHAARECPEFRRRPAAASCGIRTSPVWDECIGALNGITEKKRRKRETKLPERRSGKHPRPQKVEEFGK